ncbi:MAG: leucine--tRNA ligase [Candidatus Nealsonbacteria bacterium]
MEDYNPQEIEPKWQKFWEKEKLYQAEDPASSKKKPGPKKYILIEFPYPSGEGLHVGHVRSYSALDVVCRKKRLEGFNVLYPIGWDAFGLPTENFAIKTGIHPSVATAKNVANYTRQLKSLGLSFDWSREINTTDPKYYKWTQWIFLQLFKKDLAYQAKIPINWCPKCKAGLANEEVIDGKHERCGEAVAQKVLKQWMIRITKYADRLIEDLNKVDYLEKIKAQQINWIGKSEGTEIKFQIPDSKFQINVFTTRSDTIFGVTALVIAPEHDLVKEIIKEEFKKEVLKYIEDSKKKSEFERTQLEKEKTGVFTGSYALNPLNNEKVPIWVGDYVVATYGGGAVMVVPAHDKRDYDFAKKYNLEIREVVKNQKSNIKNKKSEDAFVEYGKLINSGEFSGLESKEAIPKITTWLAEKGLGKKIVQYKLRDWVFSRQHYWGEPIPIIHCPKCETVPVPEKDLPVELPYIEKYQPTGTGESPLSAISDWVNVKCPKCGGSAKRETDTMPNWAGSNWYYMRYTDPQNDKALADSEKLKYWLSVDWYNGGMEHTTLHLLYSRFIYKFLYDIGISPNLEPYQKRTSHGVVLAEDGKKMSKSLGNVINPDQIVKEFGADSLRLYEMFMGPFDQTIAWSENGLKGCYRFLNSLWEFAGFVRNKKDTTPKEGLVVLNKTIKKVSEDIESARFNTAVSSLMELLNYFRKTGKVSKADLEKILLIIYPFAPHIIEELWQRLGRKESADLARWPEYDEKFIKEEKIKLIIQVNGRIRDSIEVNSNISESEAREFAISSKKVDNWVAGKKIQRVIFVPGKLINIVV